MKKTTSVVVLLLLISTSVFAFPVENESKILQNEEVDLFNTVQATTLTGQEMEAIEGDGLIGAIIGGVVGLTVGIVDTVQKGYIKSDAAFNIFVTTSFFIICIGSFPF